MTALMIVTLCAVPAADPPYRSSVVGTEFDFITADDPTAFESLIFVERGRAEMPDKRDGQDELFGEAFIFDARFAERTKVRIYIDAKFETKVAARAEALRYCERLGRVPTALRSGVKRLVVHSGGPDTTAFSDVGLIVVYAANASKRIATHDLEETLFHESVHATWDQAHAASAGWKRAQMSDATFVTNYAKSQPGREDLAESALFAYTLLKHPERIPTEDANAIKAAIPARIDYLVTLFEEVPSP